jgi:hypothetical protein
MARVVYGFGLYGIIICNYMVREVYMQVTWHYETSLRGYRAIQVSYTTLKAVNTWSRRYTSGLYGIIICNYMVREVCSCVIWHYMLPLHSHIRYRWLIWHNKVSLHGQRVLYVSYTCYMVLYKFSIQDQRGK